MGEMTKRARAEAALRGEPVDRVPASLWLHNFLTENDADGLTRETLRLLETFDFDYLKPQSRAQCFAEMWGLTYQPSGQREVLFTTTHHPVRDAAGFRALRPADPRTGALGEQLDVLRRVRQAVGPDVPVIWTVFAPIMVARYLVPGNEQQVFEVAREDPAALEAGLEAITQTLEAYARLCIQAGADGLFYATTAARAGALSVGEVGRFQRPYDLRVLAAADAGWFNMLHVCGSRVWFDEFVDYPVAAYSWAAGGTNPGLAEGHRRTGRAVVGGFPIEPPIGTMPPAEVTAAGRAAIAEMGGRSLLLGPACSISPDSPDEAMHAAMAARQG